MGSRNFVELLRRRWQSQKFVCVGLDTEISKLPKAKVFSGLDPETARFEFNKAIVDATAEFACSFKPNTAFYEAQGAAGIETLQKTIAYIRESAPDVPVILDAKRADIGNTNNGYATFAFDYLASDAITVHPYLGREALKPLLDRADTGVIVLARTSNPGAGEFQDAVIDGKPLYAMVAERVAKEWNYNGNCGLVAGATYPSEISEIRKVAGDLPLLIPGIGAQGGDVQATVIAAKDSNGQGMIINSSRGIIFASDGDDFAEAARKATIELHEEISRY